MMRMDRGRRAKQDEGWFIQEGPIENHYKVWPLMAIICFPCIGALLVGFDMGGCAWMMIAIRLCSHEYNSWCDTVENNVYLAATLESMSPIAATLTCICIYIFGGSKLGGRTELILSAMFYTIGSTMEAESAEITSGSAGLIVCFVGRFIYGIGAGFSLHAIPNFVAENSPPNLRGTLGGFIEIFMTIGQIYSYAIGQWLTYEFPYDYPWKYTFKFGTLFGIIMFFGMLALPESPRWLVGAGRPLYEALEAAHFVNPDVTSEMIVLLKKDIERQAPRPINGVMISPAERLMSPALRVPMMVGLALVIAQQVTGLPGMLYYCIEIFKEVAPTDLMIALATFSVSKIVGAVAVMLLMDSSGRRPLLIGGMLLMFLSSGSLFLLFFDSLQKESQYKWAFVILLDLFVIGYEFSVGSVTFVLLGEIFPGDVKGDAVSIAFIVNFFLSAAMIFFLYWEITDIGYSVVWGQFSIMCFVFLFFAASMVPETKGKTLEQIQKEFQEEFDVPDFLDAVEYFDPSSGADDTDVGETNPLVGDAAAESSQNNNATQPGGRRRTKRSGGSNNATTTTTPLSVDNEDTPLV